MCIQTTTLNRVAANSVFGTSVIPLRSSRKDDDVDIDALCASFKKLSLNDETEDMEIDDSMDVDAIFGPLLDSEPQAMDIDAYLSPLIDPPQNMRVDAIFAPLLKFGVHYMDVDAVFGPQLASSRRN
jgi:hypothetical protein